MQLNDLDFIKLLPPFMRNDDAVKALSDGISKLIPEIYKKIRLFSVWDQIPNLPEPDLDELALELNVIWYDRTAPIDVKRQIILDSDDVYAHLGTDWAVERVIATYFGSGEVLNWFEYGGQPYHFKVISNNPRITNVDVNKFMFLLNVVKRRSAWLDAILIALIGELPLNVGLITRNYTREVHYIGWEA